MNTQDLIRLGVPQGAALRSGMTFIANYVRQGGDTALLESELSAVIAHPAAFLGDPLREAFARDLYAPAYKQRDALAPWQQWGSGLDTHAVQQMANACALPVSVAGALMPDAHVGYGLPIGGVLATEDCVIPYAVGVDIACRMRLSVYDRKANIIAGQKGRLANILQDSTVFGIGGSFKVKHQHDVMDEDWNVSPITRRFKDKAWAQLGTSGSGNHFVEFGGEVVVHRKGATPAGAGVMGVIPGSMATPGFLVRGKGKAESLNSASHGAGRVMSRTQALQSFTWSAVKKQLAAAGVELLSAGLDEVPGVYKDIHGVMDALQDLVEVLGQFSPRIVKMSPSGEKPED